ncbi:plasmid pRiA4b ORF-3 family protein [Paraburkholderia caffeinilytica]|uniref:plasmid pRiA4b ORF-3 family protein n=1 Tax=Paraburkholderia caffeinilytica TaxID=1761016 RepID=UPI003D9FEA92
MLLHVKPAVWRRIDTYASVTLSHLHEIIQITMGWQQAHLYAFRDDFAFGGRYNFAATLSAICQLGDTLQYVCDFGDNWEHAMMIEKALAARAKIRYPRCVSGNNACPPEDCGGPWGYADMLRTLADRRSHRRDELINRLGGPSIPGHSNAQR